MSAISKTCTNNGFKKICKSVTCGLSNWNTMGCEVADVVTDMTDRAADAADRVADVSCSPCEASGLTP
jgi:hypothetical protein